MPRIAMVAAAAVRPRFMDDRQQARLEMLWVEPEPDSATAVAVAVVVKLAAQAARRMSLSRTGLQHDNRNCVCEQRDDQHG